MVLLFLLMCCLFVIGLLLATSGLTDDEFVFTSFVKLVGGGSLAILSGGVMYIMLCLFEIISNMNGLL